MSRSIGEGDSYTKTSHENHVYTSHSACIQQIHSTLYNAPTRSLFTSRITQQFYSFIAYSFCLMTHLSPPIPVQSLHFLSLCTFMLYSPHPIHKKSHFIQHNLTSTIKI